MSSDEEIFKAMLTQVQEDQSEESWAELRFFLEEIYDLDIDFQLATSVVDMLMIKAGKKSGKAKHSVVPTARIALECLYLLASKVAHIQDAFETKETTTLTKMRLDEHMFDDDEEHRLLTAKLILLISTNIRKFQDISLYIRQHKKVEEEIKRLQESVQFEAQVVPRMSVHDGHISMQAGYFDVDIETVCDSFKTNSEYGLSHMEAGDRIERFGYNELPRPEPPSPLKMLFEQVSDVMIIILLVAAFTSLAVGDWKAFIVLMVVIITNVVIGFTQEYKAEKALNALLTLDSPNAKVIRDGDQEIIPCVDLVPGDVVILDEGDAVPADLRLVQVSDLLVDEAVLTGEAEPIKKSTGPIRTKNPSVGDRKNMAYMTTTVIKGRGKGIVVQTGIMTEAGKISENLRTAKQPMTPLQKRLNRLGIILVILSLVLCGIIILLGRLQYMPWLDLIKVTIALGVSVIPEGLVAVTTVTMAIGVQRMAKKNAIMRKLASVETLGSVSTICSDKTGTLTEGRMRAVVVWAGNKTYKIDGTANNPDGRIHRRGEEIAEAPFHLKKALQICCLCNNSQVRYSEEKDDWETLGDPTEIGCLIAAYKGNLGKDFWDNDGMEFVKEFAFDSNRKRMSTVFKKGDKHFILAKGGTEAILSICTSQNLQKKQKLTDELVKKLEKKATKLASNGLRVLALAYRPEKFKSDDDFKKINKVEKDLVFIGLIGMIDPPRPEVRDAIKRCQSAGIRVCMITGDHQSTAKAIAHQLGIASKHDEALRGVDIDLLANAGTLNDLQPFPRVFARVSPENKLQIVRALQAKGEVVAMTGDGVNDAPAIKNADCGIAMGIAGTDITKQVAAMVLSDDNFNTISVAVEEGRIIYDNIQKFIVYILSSNSAEIFTVLASLALGGPVPFQTMQILWANLIADVPPAMALGIDAPENDVMKRPPRDPESEILGFQTALLLLLQSGSMAALTTFSLIYAYDFETGYSQHHAQTLCFTLLTTIQLFHGFLSRSKSASVFTINPLSNLWMIGAVFGSFALLVLSIYIPYVNDFLELLPLDLFDWGKILVALIVHIAFVEIVKLIFRCSKKRRRANRYYKNVQEMGSTDSSLH
eukprot:TRINITY_DN1675_c0_g1_i1.p1 TRINITY_DN1675_c0_g1~~TRINITY_DN1675_c0_g1_i1.p1  ORF type:complete len:1107 (+),score=288.11 TRINITY_DN1675_c0_g1_i1:25-3321(+)